MPALLSLRSVGFNITLGLSALGFGLWLEHAPYPFNYTSMFLVAFFFALLSMWQIWNVQPRFAAETPATAAGGVAGPWRSARFRRVIVVTALTHIAFLAVNALIPVHLVRNLGASEGFMAAFSIVELAAGAVCSWYARPLIMRLGLERTTVIGLSATGVALLLIALTPSLPFTLAASALSGAGWMILAMVALPAMQLERTPPAQATAYAAAFTQVIMVTTFAAPFIGALLANLGLPLGIVLVLGAAVRLVSSGLLYITAERPISQPSADAPAPTVASPAPLSAPGN